MRHCERCHTFTEADVCSICRAVSATRASSVVESPADQAALERTGSYRGLLLRPDGSRQPARRRGAWRSARASCWSAPATGTYEEVIIATNFTAEGEATAHVFSEALARAASA